MIHILPINQLFYGKDIIIDFASFFILIILLIYAIKFYRLNKSQKKYIYLITSFALLATSFLAKVLSHFVIYFHNTETKQLGIISLTYQTINHSEILVFLGLLFYKILSIIAIYVFYLIYSRKTDIKNKILIFYLLIIVAIFGHFQYFIYHITISGLFFMNIVSLRNKYLTQKSETTKYLIMGFILLFISQIVFIFIYINSILYLFGEFIQMSGYLSILFGFIKVIANDVKKKR